MDFLKTLLIYMTMLSTLGVQEGPLPQEVPTPTPLPPTVTATLVPFQTEVPTATPTLTPPPVELLPANSRYDILEFQNSGNDVRKLQRRLIELGYMPEGSADGAYGYQTYNAVRDFQRVNGLSADGVAGPATLTNLYENPAILPNPASVAAVTATPAPTVAPLPTMEPGAVPESTPMPTIAPPDVTEAPAVPDLGLTELAEPLIISGVTGEPLALTAYVDDKEVKIRPHLWMNAAGDAVVSLHELTDCMDGWALGGSSVDGFYILTAAGRTVELHCGADSVAVTVDGAPVAVDAGDVRLDKGTLYITDDFLETVLGATTVFDADERSLVLLILDKRLTQN